MKNLYVFFTILLLTIGANATKYTVTNSGLTFSPNNITIGLGDTVIFTIASQHNVIEVSQSTWTANGNSPLAGGFSLPFGGGTLIITTVGAHYYVCSPHASMGMKGIINVIDNSGIKENKSSEQIKLNTFPNPVINILNIGFTLQDNSNGIIKLLDTSGNIVYLENYSFLIGENNFTIDISSLKPGYYFMVFSRGKESVVEKIIKM